MSAFIYVAGIFAILIVLILIRWYHIYSSYNKHLRHFKKIPALMLWSMLRNSVGLHDMCLTMSNELGRNVWVMLGLYPTLFTSDPKLFSSVLAKRTNKSPLHNTLERLIPESIFAVNGDKWRDQRHCINPAFDYSSSIRKIGLLNSHVDELIETLESKAEQGPIEMHGVANTFFMKFIYDSLFGISFIEDTLKINDLVNFFSKLTIEKNLKLISYFKITYMFTRHFWKERKMSNFLNEHFKAIIKKRQLARKNIKDANTKSILIDILLTELEAKKITEQYVIQQLFFIFVAGYHTTAHTICFILYSLSRNPDVQQRAYEEVISVLGGATNRSVTQQDLSRMKYLDLVIKETLRVYSTVPGIARQLEEDVAFEGKILPKGLHIFFLNFVMHLDPEIYPESEKFVPERFLTENASFVRGAYAPFSLGPRNCLGKRFAELSLKVIMAKILLCYELVDAHHELCLAMDLVTTSKNGIKIGIKKRQNQ